MLNIGFSELLLFGIVALVVLGPDKLPTAVRTAGRWYARLRHTINNLQRDIEKELQLAELREHMQQELQQIKAIEAQMQAKIDQMSGELAELNSPPAQQSCASLVLGYLPIPLQNLPMTRAPYTSALLLKLNLEQQPQSTAVIMPIPKAAL